MLYPLLLITTAHFTPTSAVVDCRTACGHCDERNDPAELLEVYCSMCEECMERREEWLRTDGDSRRGRSEKYDEESRRARTDVGFNTHSRKQYPCIPENCMPLMDQCQHPLAYHSTPGSDEIEGTISTTAATTTTTTTTRTTQRPSVPDRCCCPSMPCIPMLPVCPGMCPQMMAVTTLSTTRIEKILTGSNPSVESLYFYLGVPKKMLKGFKMN